MAKKKKPLKLRVLKELSRKELGYPGLGRKTSWEDQKAQENKDACRKDVREYEE